MNGRFNPHDFDHFTRREEIEFTNRHAEYMSVMEANRESTRREAQARWEIEAGVEDEVERPEEHYDPAADCDYRLPTMRRSA